MFARYNTMTFYALNKKPQSARFMYSALMYAGLSELEYLPLSKDICCTRPLAINLSITVRSDNCKLGPSVPMEFGPALPSVKQVVLSKEEGYQINIFTQIYNEFIEY